MGGTTKRGNVLFGDVGVGEDPHRSVHVVADHRVRLAPFEKLVDSPFATVSDGGLPFMLGRLVTVAVVRERVKEILAFEDRTHPR